MEEVKQALTPDQPAIHQIKVPGELDETWSDWDGRMTVTVADDGEGECWPVTTLTGSLDQAALQSAAPALLSGAAVAFRRLCGVWLKRSRVRNTLEKGSNDNVRESQRQPV